MTPAYITYAPVIIGVVLVIIGIVFWAIFLREKKE
jgi:hypothetical protein